MLATLRYLFHIITFHHIETTMRKTVYSDNKGLIHRINEIHNYQSIRPRRTMLSESDVELQIHDTLSILNTKATFQHVKSHQDKIPDNTTKTWQATLNIRCNEMATQTLQYINVASTVLFLPAK